MVPSHQRLEAAQPIGGEVEDRLIVKDELVLGQGLPQIELHGAPSLDFGIHFCLEEAIGATPVRFGAIQGHVGAFQQHVGVASLFRGHRDADAGTDDRALSVQRIGLAQAGDDALREQLRLPGMIRRELQDSEFIAPHARHHIRPAHASPQAFRHDPQQGIAQRMTQGIVDTLEMIQIDAQHGKPLPPQRLPQGGCHPFMQQRAVCQAGQRIMMRHESDARLRPSLFGHFLIGRNPAATDHRLV